MQTSRSKKFKSNSTKSGKVLSLEIPATKMQPICIKYFADTERVGFWCCGSNGARQDWMGDLWLH